MAGTTWNEPRSHDMPDDGAAPAAPREDVLLLVDDDPSNLSMLRAMLKDGPYRLLMAKSGEQALSVATRARPSLVLLDIMMPGIDGFETCRQLKAQRETRDAAVIFLSALDQAHNKVHGLELGAVDFISKPFDPEEVIARVQTHLKIRHLEHTLLQKNQALEAANERMRAGLAAAARVQRSFLPSTAPEMAGVRLEWRYRPCEELAGDYLNLLSLDEHHLGLFVVDICGHGVPSSLLAVQVARDLVSAGRDSLLVDPASGAIAMPSAVAGRLNAKYPMEETAGLFFTFLYGLLDLRSRRLTFVSAGNPGPVQMSAAGNAQVHDAPGLPIGMFPDADYDDSIIELAPGDRLFMHSDGLTEERNASGEMFGNQRMLETLAKAAGADLGGCADALLDRVVDWHGSDAFTDDIAVVALELDAS